MTKDNSIMLSSVVGRLLIKKQSASQDVEPDVPESLEQAVPLLVKSVRKTNTILSESLKTLNALKDSLAHGDDDEDEALYLSERQDKVFVTTKCVFLKLGKVDTINQTFEADIYIEAKWREPVIRDLNKSQLQDVDFSKLWDPKLTLLNLTRMMDQPNRDKTWHSIISDSQAPISGPFIVLHRRVKAVFFEALELELFPLDVQELTVQLTSERSLHEVDIVANFEEASTVNKARFRDASQWDLFDQVEVTPDSARMLFTKKPSNRAVLHFTIRVARKYAFFLWNVSFIVLLITLLTFSAYTVDPKLPQRRMALNLTLLLTTVAFKMVINNNLPRIDYLTYMDRYVLTALVFLFLQVLQSALVSIVANSDPIFANSTDGSVTLVQTNFAGRPDARKIDKICVAIFAVAVVVYHIIYAIKIYYTAGRARRRTAKKDILYRGNNFALCHRRDAEKEADTTVASPDDSRVVVNMNTNGATASPSEMSQLIAKDQGADDELDDKFAAVKVAGLEASGTRDVAAVDS